MIATILQSLMCYVQFFVYPFNCQENPQWWQCKYSHFKDEKWSTEKETVCGWMISKWRSGLSSQAGMEPTLSCVMLPASTANSTVYVCKHPAYRGEDQSPERVTCSRSHRGGTTIWVWCWQSQSLCSSSLLEKHP